MKLNITDNFDTKYFREVIDVNIGQYLLDNFILCSDFCPKLSVPCFNTWTIDGTEVGSSFVKRVGAKFLFTRYIVIDFDNDLSIAEYTEKYGKFKSFIYSTYSNDLNKERFRAVIKLSEFLHYDNARAIESLLLKYFEGCDPTTFQPSRLFSFPVVRESKTESAFFKTFNGEEFDVFKELNITEFPEYKKFEAVKPVFEGRVNYDKLIKKQFVEFKKNELRKQFEGKAFTRGTGVVNRGICSIVGSLLNYYCDRNEIFDFVSEIFNGLAKADEINHVLDTYVGRR